MNLKHTNEMTAFQKVAVAEYMEARKAADMALAFRNGIDAVGSKGWWSAQDAAAVACREAHRAEDHAYDCGAAFKPYWHVRYDAYGER